MTNIPFGEVVKSCAIAVIRILLFCVMGFLLARKRIISEKEIRGLSKISQDLLIPTLTFANFVTMDRSYIVTYYPVIICSLIIIFLGMLVGKLVGKYIVREKQYSTMFAVVCGFTHTLNIQLSISEALGPVLDQIDANAGRYYTENAQARGPIFVMMYTIVNTIVRWSLLTSLIKRQDDGRQAPPVEVSSQGKQDPELNYVSVPEQFPSADQIAGSATVNVNANVDDTIVKKKKAWWKRVYNFFNVPLVTAFLSIIIAVIPPVQRAFINKDSVLFGTFTKSVNLISDASSPVLLVLLGANFGYTDPAEGEQERQPVPKKVIGGASLAKMVIMPILGALIIYGFSLLNIMKDPAMMVVILTSFAAPTANNLLVQYANHGKDMVTVSKMVLGTYISAIVTIPATIITFFAVFPFY